MTLGRNTESEAEKAFPMVPIKNAFQKAEGNTGIYFMHRPEFKQLILLTPFAVALWYCI